MPRRRRGRSGPRKRALRPAPPPLDGSTVRHRYGSALAARFPGRSPWVASGTRSAHAARAPRTAAFDGFQTSPSFRRVARRGLSLPLHSMARHPSPSFRVRSQARRTCGTLSLQDVGFGVHKSSFLRFAHTNHLAAAGCGGTPGNRSRALRRSPDALRAPREPRPPRSRTALPRPRKEASHGREGQPLGAGPPAPHRPTRPRACAPGAEASGLGLSAYIRRAALSGGEPAPVADARELRPLYAELRRCGSNVNQIARHPQHLRSRRCWRCRRRLSARGAGARVRRGDGCDARSKAVNSGGFAGE